VRGGTPLAVAGPIRQEADRMHTVTKALAHVERDENLFIHWVARGARAHRFESELVVDGTHPYLYENPAVANHVSGTTFLDAARQVGKAISHLFYEVPIESRFGIQSVQAEYPRWTKLGVPIRLVVDIIPATAPTRAKSIRRGTMVVTFRQEGRAVCVLRLQIVTLTKQLEDTLMRRQYAEAPVPEAAATDEPTAALG
jgi:hypothetical protein